MIRDLSLVNRESHLKKNEIRDTRYKIQDTKMELSLLIDKIKRDKGLDLSGYKESTLTRRIERRMQFDGVKSLEEYIPMLDRDHHLYWRLISDFFIGVTDFFRDKEIWEIMGEKIVPEIIERKLSAASFQPSAKNFKLKAKTKPILRIWTAGCSTGEETYSFAILLNEVLGDSISDFLIYIYGTDILEDKLEIARKGEYDGEKVEKIEPQLRQRYLELIVINAMVDAQRGHSYGNQESGLEYRDYRIRDNLRQPTRFRKYDLVQGEELRGFDIIVCRNVLIYFQKHLQEKVLKNFHRALREGGVLWLGTAESLSGEAAKLFEPVYKNEKIFKKV